MRDLPLNKNKYNMVVPEIGTNINILIDEYSQLTSSEKISFDTELEKAIERIQNDPKKIFTASTPKPIGTSQQLFSLKAIPKSD